MRIRDYLRLGLANISYNRRRCVLVTVITGAMFAVIFAGFELIQGLENITRAETTRFTDGQVVLQLTVMDRNSDSEEKLAALVAAHGGYTESVERYRFDGMAGLYLFPERLKASLADKILAYDAEEGIPILLSVSEAGKWQKLVVGRNQTISQKLDMIAKIHQQSLGKPIENNSFGTRPDIEKTQFFVAGLLPSTMWNMSLSLDNVGDQGNPLNILLGAVSTGGSSTFLLERPADVASEPEDGALWAVFPNSQIAYDFVMDRQICSNLNKTCLSKYRYEAENAISNPLEIEVDFAGIWRIYNIVWLILAIIALIIMMSTYSRLINQEVKNIALYRALGATRTEAYIIYAVYLAMLSLIAMVVALIVGTLMAFGVSWIYHEALVADFIIGFGTEPASVWLVGWNNTVFAIMALGIIAALVSVVMNIFQFSAARTAQRLK